MAASKTPKADTKKASHKKKDRAAEIANTFEWLITAFILAFVFRAFVMEAFRIPTGSMADTLMGAHFRLRCPECGYRYEYGFSPHNYGLPQDTIPPGAVPIRQQTRCPSCGFYTSGAETLPVANGDRILVLKCIYQFMEPKRWDVIVFKNPTDPTENYIKRLIGLPGEEVEIIEGDVYINGQIARKPARVQDEVWMPVYNHDFQPVNPNQRGAFNRNRWQPPFDFEASDWQISAENPTELVLDTSADKMSVLTYGAPSANELNVTYAYNEVRQYARMPDCNDLMVRFYMEPGSTEGRIGIMLSERGVDYKAWLDLSGEMVLARASGGEDTILKRKSVDAPTPDAFTRVTFANVDQRLIFTFDGNTLEEDLGRSPPDPLQPGARERARAAIFGSGTLTLSHVAIFRDIHYTGDGQTNRSARAVKGSPFRLNDDEFFVLGDNSPNSEDGRWWEDPDVASKGWAPPRAGVVPRYYLVGKAMFVYWPSGFDFPWPRNLKNLLLNNSNRNPAIRLIHGIVSLRWIPNFGRMRFIYGGTERNTNGSPQDDQHAQHGERRTEEIRKENQLLALQTRQRE